MPGGTEIPIEHHHPLWGRLSTTCIADPSPRRLARLFAEAKDGQIRGIAFGDLLVVFPAHEATHWSVRTAMGMPPLGMPDAGSDFWVVPADAEPFSDDWSANDDDPVRDGMRLIVGRNRDAPCLAKLLAWFADAPSPAVRPR